MTDDAELLRRYADEKSEEAFGELVRRHIDFVYGVALRQVRGNAALAEEVAQIVFTDLARKSGALSRHAVVVGWLHTATRFAVAKAIRTEARRTAREREAHLSMITAVNDTEAAADWERLHPVLDAVLGELKERERTAILLRFFEKKPFGEVGEKLAVTEHAARLCVDRALEKMRGLLARRGVTSTSAALGMALANQVGVAAPAGLAASVTGVALVGGSTASATATLIGLGLFDFMGKTTSIVLAVGLLGLAGGFGIYHARTKAALVTEIEWLQSERQRLLARHEKELGALQAKLAQPSQRTISIDGTPAQGGAGRGPEPTAPPPVAVEADSPLLAAAKEKLSRIGNVRESSLESIPGFDAATIATIRAWVSRDPEGVVRWLGTIDSAKKQREHATEALIWLELDRDPEMAFLLANSIGAYAARINRSRDVIRQWAARDPAAATRAIAAANLPEADRKSLMSVVKAFGLREN